MNKVIEKIKELEDRHIENIKMIALVSDTSAEVIFYGTIDGIKYQSNNMVEAGKVDADIVDKFYGEVTKAIRDNEKYNPAKMNIIKADSNGCEIDYDEKNCKTYKIIRDWEKNL